MKVLEKHKAIALRKSGMTISEIGKIVPVSKSTIALWVKDLRLSKVAKESIQNKLTLAQNNSRAVLVAKNINRQIEINEFSKRILSSVNLTKEVIMIMCACLYEAEGGKGVGQSLSFTNSDPLMVGVFLKMLRRSFELDESKFRVCFHAHSYHNIDGELDFWSKTTQIPRNQFIKPYLKKTSSSYKKDGYRGCVSIRYYDISLKKKLLSIFKEIERHI